MFEELVKNRYSCRSFKDIKVEEDKLQKILEVGNLAPTAKNSQPHRIYILESEEALNKLDSLTHCRYGAKTVLLFTYNEDEEWKNPFQENIHSGVEDVSIVATHIMLEAKELGLDTCWINYFNNTKLEDLFNLPKNEKSVLLMPIGYANERAVVAPSHTNKKDLKDLIKRI